MFRFFFSVHHTQQTMDSPTSTVTCLSDDKETWWKPWLIVSDSRTSSTCRRGRESSSKMMHIGGFSGEGLFPLHFHFYCCPFRVISCAMRAAVAHLKHQLEAEHIRIIKHCSEETVYLTILFSGARWGIRKDINKKRSKQSNETVHNRVYYYYLEVQV